METFKQFLESRGAELCKTNEFLSYYALPYVPDPRQHPSFRDMFTVRILISEKRHHAYISVS